MAKILTFKQAGVKAYHDGWTRFAPSVYTDRQADSWYAGWDAAQLSEENLITQSEDSTFAEDEAWD